MPRCFWCTDDPLYQAYHDQEWGTPQRDPALLFEMLLLEGFQAGFRGSPFCANASVIARCCTASTRETGADERRESKN
jgi:hypothetical protein